MKTREAIPACLICVCLGGLAAWQGVRFFSVHQEGGIYPMVEISFRLPGEAGDPFAREIWGRIGNESGDGIWLPAYFNGEGIWKLRFTPRSKGDYRVRIFEEEKGVRQPRAAADLKPENFSVTGPVAGPGFVRIDSENPRTFIRDGGSFYYPVGMNIGWDMGEQGDVVAFLERLAAAGGNWSRIWMCHWDDKNLDWPQDKTLPPGEIDLAAALKWDRIVAAADRLRIPFQMVLQHHGQFSNEVNAVWNENPWNAARGGFLHKAEDFFTDARARLLTKRKYRYIVARYGYSPSVLAWELFNEVEFTAAGKTAEGRRTIFEWHKEMAEYLRSIDPYRHLITTSSPSLEDPVWSVADFYQQHAYPPDPLAGAGGFATDPRALARPIFYGEIGSMDPGGQTLGDGGRVFRDVLWGGIFAGAGATAQYWAWDQADREKMYPLITALARFAERAELGQGFWRAIPAAISTSGRADLVFGPGQRWESVPDPHLQLRADGAGRPDGTRFSSTLRPRRGSGEREGTDSATFHVEMDRPGRWEITVSEVSPDGARMEMEADGRMLASRTWEPAAETVRAKELPWVLGVDLPADCKVLRVKSSGADYFQISSVRLKGYGPELGIRAMTNDRKIVLWIYRPEGLPDSPFHGGQGASATGRVRLQGILDGNYRVIWWDTAKAAVLREDDCQASGGRAELSTPSVYSDVAVLLIRQGP